MTSNQSVNFSDFYKRLADELDISESRMQQAIDSYEALGRWLRRDGSVVAGFNPQIYPQGSFRLGTVIKPVTDAEEYDVDLVCELTLKKTDLTQAQLKQLVGVEVKSYAAANNMKSPVEEGKRCWTLNYADGAQFHMDILPAVPDSGFQTLLMSKGYSVERSKQAIAITDKTHPEYGRTTTNWLTSNPKGYSDWFREQMTVQFELQKKYFAEAAKASGHQEPVPDYKVKTPLQRVVQLLKRHRDLMFIDDQDDKPISIIITTLAAHAYQNEADLREALTNILFGMPKFIESKSGVAWVPNPVNPLENFADKWGKYPQREQKFRSWLRQAERDLVGILQEDNADTVNFSLQSSFGKSITDKILRPQSVLMPAAPLVMRDAYALAKFNVPHRRSPQWPVTNAGRVNVTCYATRKGFRTRQFSSDSAIGKDYKLRFEASTKIPRPFKVYWQVVNTGREADGAHCLRGGFYDGLVERGGLVRNESTLYGGMHWIECFIVKDGYCIARSGEFVVNIQ